VYVAALLGEAHRRGADSPPKRPWTAEEREALVDRAIRLAVVHEAAWLVYCKAP
jgi:hypothetical protein